VALIHSSLNVVRRPFVTLSLSPVICKCKSSQVCCAVSPPRCFYFGCFQLAESVPRRNIAVTIRKRFTVAAEHDVSRASHEADHHRCRGVRDVVRGLLAQGPAFKHAPP